eukprot:CAMPEP_0196205516 /NCGR_PEP_ID=MMETSP0912-20130531/7236_1 /TAXON_ID=49265 /ORGANISM="Thalassiosira rotula, Strain GSO102" /LENGTH=80 /DNA_ID=CAMNT_0041479907 /DNA_START=394 /DNA_END=636 /DNA_ORIENTATION=+
MTLCESFNTAVDKGSSSSLIFFGEEDDCEEIMDEEDNLYHSLGYNDFAERVKGPSVLCRDLLPSNHAGLLEGDHPQRDAG